MQIKLLQKCLFCLLLIILIFSCGNQNHRGHQVTVSILPLADFVRQIAGDKLDVNVLIPKGANHSSCDFSVQQLRSMKESILCFTIGHLAFEQAQLFPMLEEQPLPEVVRLADDCTLIESNCSCGHIHKVDSSTEEETYESVFKGKDPHIWMSPRMALQIVDEIFHELKEKYPRYEKEFTANYAEYRAKIVNLDKEATRRLASKKGKAFIIYHPALTYFASDYGLEQISIERDGKLPSPQVLKEVIEKAHGKEVKLILVQEQFDIQSASSVAKEVGCNVKTINPLTNNWLHEMEQLIIILEENL